MSSDKVMALRPDGPSEAEWQARVDLAACYRLAAHFGFDDIIWNHISARVPGEEDAFLINPFGLRYDEICASNLVKVDLEGKSLDGGETNLTGFIIHSAIHRRRPDIQCVMHTHSEAGMVISALKEGLQPFVQDAWFFYNRIGYHDYEGISTDAAERERLAESLGDHKALVLRNHGLLTAGRTIGEAFMLMHYLERSCRVQTKVLATGQDVSLPSPELCEKAYQQYANFWPGDHEWPALVRLMDKIDPSFRD